MGQLRLLIIHCTASQEGKEMSSAQIRKLHLSPPPAGRGWHQVGYSDMVHLNGEIENLVPYDGNDKIDLWEITNGASGMNSIARHIVYVGGVDAKCNPKDTRTFEQKVSLRNFVKQFLQIHPEDMVAGHNHFAAKACPSFDVEKWLYEIGVAECNIYRKGKKL